MNSQGISAFLDHALFSDITLELPDGRQIKAHKVILAARSSYFEAMLSGSFAESQQEVVKMPEDHGPKALDHMLRYVYSGRLEIGGMAADDRYVLVLELHKLARYYGIPDLESAALGVITSALETCHAKDVQSCIKALLDCDVGELDSMQDGLVEACTYELLKLMSKSCFESLILKHTNLGAALLVVAHRKGASWDEYCLSCLNSDWFDIDAPLINKNVCGICGEDLRQARRERE